MSSGQPTAGDTSLNQENMLAVYQAANLRYASNTTLQWQIPLYVIPTQVGLVAGIVVSHHAIAAVLGATAFVVGLVGWIVMRRIELTARWDRQTLDDFESQMLPRDSPLRLLHDAQFSDRLRERQLKSSATGLRKLELRLMLLFPPSLMICVLMILFGALAAVVGAFR
ncbi:MAG TPA: hypothetical protein VMI13_13285 [Solirubrobacteraceae bacterium]|nr:hypothetical protein [Solirubrobacteraceae bacterium]